MTYACTNHVPSTIDQALHVLDNAGAGLNLRRHETRHEVAVLAAERGLSPAVEGLLVMAVAPDGPAARAGLRVDDVVVEIDQDVVLGHDDAARQVGAAVADARGAMLFLVDRDGETMFAVLRLSPNGAE